MNGNCNSLERNVLLHFGEFFYPRRYLAIYYGEPFLVYLDCKLDIICPCYYNLIFPSLASLQCVHVILTCNSRRHWCKMLLTLRLLLKFIFDRINSQNLRKEIEN